MADRKLDPYVLEKLQDNDLVGGNVAPPAYTSIEALASLKSLLYIQDHKGTSALSKVGQKEIYFLEKAAKAIDENLALKLKYGSSFDGVLKLSGKLKQMAMNRALRKLERSAIPDADITDIFPVPQGGNVINVDET